MNFIRLRETGCRDLERFSMKKTFSLFIAILFSFSLLFVTSCESSSSSNEIPGDFSNLTTPVIDGEFSGLCGDQAFIEKNNLVMNDELVPASDVIYVSPDGLDSNDGSLDAPYKTFSKALSELSPGKTLYLKSGTYTEQLVLGSEIVGTKENYINITGDMILNSESTENLAILDGTTFSEDFRLMVISGASYVRISHLSFKNSNGLDAAGIIIEPPSNHIIIDNCSFSDIKVPEPQVQDHVANGISCFGDSTESINNILLYKNSFTNMATGWGECISITGNCENINIVENTVDNTGNIGIDVGGNYGYCNEPSLDFARWVYIYKNTVKNCESAYGDTAYGIYADGGQHIQIIENIVRNCSGGIEAGGEETQKSIEYATSDVLIKENVVTNCAECALSIGGYEEELGWVCNVKVIENNFTDNADKADGALITLNKCNSVLIENNTFTESDGVYGGTFLYEALSDDYIRNVSIGTNVLNGIE